MFICWTISFSLPLTLVPSQSSPIISNASYLAVKHRRDSRTLRQQLYIHIYINIYLQGNIYIYISIYIYII